MPPETLAEDVSLWKKCIAGEKEAWDSLVKKYSKLVYGKIWAKLKQYQESKDINVSDVENIYQDVFLKILQKLYQWEKRSSLATWIVAITVRATIDHHRKQKPNLFVSLNDKHINQGKQSYDEEWSLDDEQNPYEELSFDDWQKPLEEKSFDTEQNPDEEQSFQETKAPDPADTIFIRNLLKSLNPSELIVIRLHFLEEWSLGEIAEFLNKKVGTIYVIKSRALDKLRETCQASGLM